MRREGALRPRLIRYSLWLVGGSAAACRLPVGLLAFPQVLLANRAEAGVVVVYYDGNPDPGVQRLADDTDRRLRAGGFGDSENPARLFYFRRTQGLYSFFTRLAWLPAEPQGFAVPLLGTTYVSGPRVEALGNRKGRGPTFSIWEGSIPHTMAHEIAHLHMADSIGRATWWELPQWKQEGYPEYVANIGLIREDSAASLPRRIEILTDDGRWSGPRSWDRIHYEAGLLTEFLLDVRGYGLRAVIADSTTREEAHSAMMEWYRDQESGDRGG